MNELPTRRRLLHIAAAVPLFPGTWFSLLAPKRAAAATVKPRSRVRPGDPAWPSEERWRSLGQEVQGALIKVQSPLAGCLAAPAGPACAQMFKMASNPYFLGDEVGLTQTLAWVDAWTSRPSTYAVAARTTKDVVAAVNFAREHNLRLVVKGGGHSYQGTSNAPDSLLIWTRKMNEITLHDTFVGAGCEGRAAPVRAATIGAGAVWAQAYDAVSTRGGGYVQGGGCMTVGVAGLVQSGGFGSFSKAYGLAAGSLLQAEVVTADGAVRIANACVNPDLFWGLKGGGGGSLGVVTRLTLRVHPLPEQFGAVDMTIKATSAPAFRKLVGLIIDFCSQSLLNPHWGEQIRLRPENVLKISMVFQGLDRSRARAVWQPFLDSLAKSPEDFKVLHGYQSAWLPVSLLQDAQRRQGFCDALFAATRHWGVSLHLNKGLAGAPADAVAAAKDTAMNPAVLDVFALAICGAQEPPAYPGVAGHEPNAALARRRVLAIQRAMDELRKVVPNAGSYLAESNFFEPNWPQSFWGPNYSRLLAVKARYDPDGLFFVHHGVGSERWSADGFTQLAPP